MSDHILDGRSFDAQTIRVRCGAQPRHDNEQLEWAVTEADRRRAILNHGQTLERLNQRGGVTWCEMLAILEDRPWHSMEQIEARAGVYDLLKARPHGEAQQDGKSEVPAIDEAINPDDYGEGELSEAERLIAELAVALSDAVPSEAESGG